MQEPGNFSQPGSPFGPTTPIPAPTGYQASMQSGLRTIRRVDLASAFKVGAILSAMFWAVFGLFFVMFGSVISSMAAASGQRGAGLPMVGGFMAYLMGIVMYAIFGGIFTVIYAFMYNLVAGWVGGLQVEID